MKNEIILFTTGCPQCKVLEAKLEAKKVKYTSITDVDIMIEKGMTHTPMLEVDGQLMNFKQSLEWLNKKGEGDFGQL